MLKRLKKKARKPKRTASNPSSDPNRRARQLMDEHMAKVEAAEPPWNGTPPVDVKAIISAHMAKLGAKGGRVGGKRRLETMTETQRKQIAKKAAVARWSGRKKGV